MNYRYVVSTMFGVALLFARPSCAQTVPVLSDTRAALSSVEKKDADAGLVAPGSLRKVDGQKPVEVKTGRFYKAEFIALSAGVYGAALLDMHQTMHVRHYSWWTETDPLARPFVRLPPPAYYVTGFALATGVNWLGSKMGHSRRWHKLAAIPQLVSIGGNMYGYRSNCYPGY